MQSLNGFRDFYPAEMAERTHVFAAMRRVAERFGFVEWDGPPLELLELYTRKSGAEIVSQLYNFVDQGGREVALRPEMTPTLARMIAARAGSLPKPVKWYSIPQLFRSEKKQRGRLREHFQLNVDIIGAHEVEADAELLAVALGVQRELGLTKDDVVARVNDRRLVAGALQILEVPPENIGKSYTAIDKFRKTDADKFAAMLIEAGVPERHVAEVRTLCEGSVRLSEWYAPHLDKVDETTRKSVSDLERYLSLLESMGLGDFVEVDFSIVRGLAYYTGIVFELFDRAGKERAICGGGRYDDLIASLGGPDLPALGFGMGDVVLSLMLRDRGLMPDMPPRVDAIVIPVESELGSAAWNVVTRLRESGVRAETPYSASAVGRELKSANRQDTPFAVIVGPDEWAEESVNLKDLRSGEQKRVPLSELAAQIQRG